MKRKEVQQKNKDKKLLKKGHEPWPDKEKIVMQLGIDQLIQKKDSMRQELQTEEIGLDEMDKEIQVNIDQAAIKVKAAKMDLASMLFDQMHDITIRKHKNRVIELGQEISRLEHNIEVFQKQLDEGRPKKVPEKKPAAKPEHRHKGFEDLHPVDQLHEGKKTREAHNKLMKEGAPTTQEEANNIAGEDEAKASEGQ